MAKCLKCGEEAKLIEAGAPWSSYYCGPCNRFFWEKTVLKAEDRKE